MLFPEANENHYASTREEVLKSKKKAVLVEY
jgi:hypothetical protein